MEYVPISYFAHRRMVRYVSNPNDWAMLAPPYNARKRRPIRLASAHNIRKKLPSSVTQSAGLVAEWLAVLNLFQNAFSATNLILSPDIATVFFVFRIRWRK